MPDNPKQKVRAHEYPQDLFHSTHYLDQLVFLWFRSEQHKWNMVHSVHPCLPTWYKHHPPPTNFKIKTFPEVALWRWVVNWDYWRVLIPSLPPLTCTDYSAFDLCVHLHFLESMQIVERPIWNGVDPIVGEIPTKKKKKIPFLRNASLKYSCNP